MVQRENLILTRLEGESAVRFAAGYRCYPFHRGGWVNQIVTANTVGVTDGHEILTGDYLLSDPGSRNTILGPVTVLGNNQISIPQKTGFYIGQELFSLGPNSSDYTGSRVTVWVDPDKRNEYLDGVIADALGRYSYWYELTEGRHWELFLDAFGAISHVLHGFNPEDPPSG